MKRLLTTGLGICFLFSAWTQDLKKDLDQMRRQYEQIDAFELHLAYLAYEDHQSSKVQDQTEAVYIKKGNQYYTRVYSVETLVNERYVIALDHTEKLFMIDRRPKDGSKVEMNTDGLGNVIDELAAKIEQGGPVIARKEYAESPGGLATHTIWFNQGPYTKQEITYKKSSYLLQKNTVYFREEQEMEEGKPLTKPRLEMVYRKFDESPALSPDFFSEERFVSIVPNKSLKLKLKYTGYQVINHLWKQDYRDYYSH